MFSQYIVQNNNALTEYLHKNNNFVVFLIEACALPLYHLDLQK
jgi:hypothetical protein